MSQKDLKQNKNIKESVLDRIEAADIRPRSKWFWRCRSSLVWVLWGLSIVLGALSVAILIFASAHVRFSLFEATHSSRLALALEIMPYAWVGVFGLMLGFAYFNFRHTDRGYRYPLVHIILSSIGFSVVGGVLLHVAGLGYQLDMSLGRMSDMYKSQEEIAISLWQRPKEGRLVGKLLKGSVGQTKVTYKDIDGTTWLIQTTDLSRPDINNLLSGLETRVIGVLATNTPGLLHGCGVFHWPFSAMPKQGYLEQERKEFLDRLYAHKDLAKERTKELILSASESQVGPCSKLEAIERMSKSMK